MKSSHRIILACTAVGLLTGLSLTAQSPSVLEPKAERHEGPPLWISAVAVADASKIVDVDRIDSLSLRAIIEKQRQELGDQLLANEYKAGKKPTVAAIPLAECRRMQSLEDERGGRGSTADLSALAANSKSILRGTIRTIDFGFDGGVPASLLGVESSEVVKGPAPPRLFYISYPVARFRIGPFQFCNAAKGFEPHEGDEVILFDFMGAADRNEILFTPRMDQLIFQSPSGPIFLPPQLKSSKDLETAISLTDIVVRVRSGASLNPRGATR
jgi:hypothetical protein